MAKVDILIPAAGASMRMGGRDKLLEMVGGVEQLRRVAEMAVYAAGYFAGHVFVTLPSSGPLAPSRRQVLTGLRATILSIPDAHEGMAASLRAGAMASSTSEGLMLLPADMPELTADDLRYLMKTFSEDTHVAIRATSAGGAVGHPVIFPRRLFGSLSVLTGDQGGRKVLLDEDVRNCPLPGTRAITDLDAPEDWQAWRKRTGN